MRDGASADAGTRSGGGPETGERDGAGGGRSAGGASSHGGRDSADAGPDPGAAEPGGNPGGEAGAASVAPDRGRLLSLTRIRRILGGLPAFGKLLFRLMGDPRVSLLDRAIFGAALVYLFVPMDLVPDWVPAFGQLDDLLVVLFTLDRLLYRTDPAVLADNWDGDDDSLAALRGLLERAADVLPGWARALLRAG